MYDHFNTLFRLFEDNMRYNKYLAQASKDSKKNEEELEKELAASPSKETKVYKLREFILNRKKALRLQPDYAALSEQLFSVSRAVTSFTRAEREERAARQESERLTGLLAKARDHRKSLERFAKFNQELEEETDSERKEQWKQADKIGVFIEAVLKTTSEVAKAK
jgi:hypothetical protein